MLFQASSLLLHSKWVTTMTAPHIVNRYELLCYAFCETSADRLRTPLQTSINMLRSADAEFGAKCGAPVLD